MSFLSKSSKRFHKSMVRKNGKKHTHSTRTKYLLDKQTPFNITEAFRNLKAALSVSVPKRQGGVAIMTTSALPEDGKTTVTVNLALMFALSNAKVVLLDADIRKGVVAKYFKQKSIPGLSDYLSGQASLDQVTHQSEINENLSFITCGTHSPRPYELLESNEMVALMEELKQRYDYVIVDTPPVLLVSDALALTSITDGVALVCRHQVSYVSDIAHALNTLKFAKANILGVVVNDYKEMQTDKYYDGYKKYYRYSAYSYGSTNPEDKDDGSDITLKIEEEKTVIEQEEPEKMEEKTVEKPVEKKEEPVKETPVITEEKKETVTTAEEEPVVTLEEETVQQTEEIPETEEDKANRLAELRNKYSR